VTAGHPQGLSQKKDCQKKGLQGPAWNQIAGKREVQLLARKRPDKHIRRVKKSREEDLKRDGRNCSCWGSDERYPGLTC